MADGSVIIDTKIDKKNLKNQVQEISKELTKVQKNTSSAFAKMRDIMQGPVAALGMIRNALSGVGDATVGQAAAIEDMTAAFTPLVGNAENAVAMINALNKEAATTPFELQGIGNIAKQLLPVLGNDVQAVTETFRMLGDTAGGNIQKLDTITRGYMKSLLKGKVDMESMNMIAEAGVPIYTELADSMGVSVQKMMEMSKGGQITADDMTAAFQKMTSEGGIFFNGMDVASQTLNGKLSTMSDNLAQSGATIGAKLLPAIKSIVDTVNVVAGAFVKWATTGNNLDKALMTVKRSLIVVTAMVTAYGVATLAAAVTSIPAMITALGGMVVGLATTALGLSATTVATNGFTAALLANPAGAIIAAIVVAVGLLVLAFFKIRDNWDVISVYLSTSLATLKQNFKLVGVAVETAFIVGFNSAKMAAISFAQLVIDKVFGAVQKLLDVLSGLPLVGDMFKDISNKVDGFKSKLDESANAAKAESQTAIASANAKKEAIVAQGNAELATIKKSRDERLRDIAIQKASEESAAKDKETANQYAQDNEALMRDQSLANIEAVDTARTQETNNAVSGTEQKISINEELIKSLDNVQTKYSQLSISIQSSFSVGLDAIKKSGETASNSIKGIQETLNIITFTEPIGQAKKLYESILAVDEGIKTIIKDGPKIAKEMANALFDAFVSILDNLPELATAMVGMIEKIIVSLAEHLPDIIVALIKTLVILGPTLALAVLKALPAMVKALALLPFELVKALPSAFMDIGRELWGIGKEIVEGIGKGILAVGSFIQWIGKIIPKPSDFQSFNIADIGKFIVDSIAYGIMIFGSLFSKVVTFFQAFTNELIAFFINMPAIGKSIIDGIVQGIMGAPALWESVMQFFVNFIDAIKRFFLIASPSAVFAEFGGFLIQGLVNGINSAPAIFDSVKDVFQGLLDSIEDMFAAGFDLGSGLMDGIKDGIDSAGDLLGKAKKAGGNIADKTKDFFGFSKGGYTGDGSPDEVAGIVHKGEYVLTADQTKSLGLNGNKSISSIINGLTAGVTPTASIAAPTSSINITLNNIMHATMTADGRALAQLVFKNIDRVNTGAYGTNR